MSDRELVPIRASDQTWLHMDRKNNLMHIHSMLWLNDVPDFDDYVTMHQERMVDRYDVFRQRPVEQDGQWYWEFDPDFDIHRHIQRTVVPGEGKMRDLRAYMGERFSQQFDFDHPLWDIELITGLTGADGKPAAVSFQRYHHALADGIRLVQMLLGLCDFGDVDKAEAVPGQVGRGRSDQGLVEAGATLVRQGAEDLVDIARHVVTNAPKMPATMVSLLRPSTIGQSLAAITQPGKMLDLLEKFASTRNESLNTVAEVTRMVSAPPEAKTSWTGRPGVRKQITWVWGIDLGEIKQVAATHRGTVNDILLAIISKALTRYLDERGTLIEEIHWLVPVSLKPLDSSLPDKLGNHFALIYLPMPLGIDDTSRLVRRIQRRMARLKNSGEPIFAYAMQRLIAETPRVVSVGITNLFANKAVGVLTNVPGPTRPMTFAGVDVGGCLGFVPTTANEALGLCIFSYNGEVTVGIAADATLIPNPQRIADLIREEHAEMVRD